MHILHLAAFVVVALLVDTIHASGAGHNFGHRGRYFAKRNAANLNQNVTERALERRFDNARFTFFAAGLGACGKVNSGHDFIVALNSAQYGNGAHCFETITINVGGKTHSAEIVDECPGCPFGGLDFSESLFQFFAPESVGVLTGSWNFGGSVAPAPHPAPPPPPKTTNHPPPPSPTHTTQHHNPPATTAPEPKPTTSPKSGDTTQGSPSDTRNHTDASSTPSSASATTKSNAALATPTGTSPLASSPAAGNIALMYANMVYMGSMIISGDAASTSNSS